MFDRCDNAGSALCLFRHCRKALLIFYEDACTALIDRPRLTTLDIESPGGNPLVPALFEMRYGRSLRDYVAEKEAKWLPLWRARDEEPYELRVIKAYQIVQAQLSADPSS